jgi:hypothetical protein
MRQILFGTLFIIFSCTQRESLTIDQEIQKLNKPYLSFIIENDKIDTILTTNGTRLIIQPNSFEFNDESLPNGPIKIELKEVFLKSDMISNGLTTMSDGNLLESFGMINLKAESNGQELRIRKNMSLILEIPNKKRGTRGELFYGKLNEKKIIEWEYEGGNDIIEVTDTILQRSNGLAEFKRTTYKIINYKKYFVSDTSFTATYYSNADSTRNTALIYIPGHYKFEIKKLGWINCDRFVEVKNKTTLSIELADYSIPTGFIVFDSLNSAMNIFFDNNGKTEIQGLPDKSLVELIILDKIGDNVFWSKTSLTTGMTKNIKVKTDKITLDQLKLELNKIGE